jgi:hypothetical protein
VPTDRRYGSWSKARRDRHASACRKLTDKDRIQRYIIKSTGCWEWQGAINSTGYGTIGIGSRRDNSRRTILAHRMSYEIFVGPIPNSLNVLHKCDNPSCINPSHLFLGTIADNVHDMMSKGRHKCLRGSQVKSSVLNEVAVRKVKSLFGKMNDCQIARKFGVSDSLIWGIRHGYSWRHVQ